MTSSRQAFSLPGFFSGGLSSNHGQVSQGGIGGLFPYICSSPRYHAMRSWHFSLFAVA
jgi:hypothetical protein